MGKGIDIANVKAEVHKGSLNAYCSRAKDGKTYIYLQDTQNGETVKIGEVEDE